MMGVACIGAGYVGLVSSVGLASAGHRVAVVEIDAERLAALRDGRVPFHEPDLAGTMAGVVARGLLTFHGSIEEAVSGREVVLVAVPTRPRADGSADTDDVESVCLASAPHLDAGAVLVIRSTVPVGTAESIGRRLAGLGTPVTIVSNPEFLREGRALADFLQPHRIVIGSADPAAAETVGRLYEGCGAPLVVTDPASAEMVKYAANSYLATRISFVNEIAELSEAMGTRLDDVLAGIGHDPRIGSRYLKPGPGFGGSCLPKDTLALISTAEDHGCDMRLLRATMDVNRHQIQRTLAKIRDAAPGGLAGKTVAFWGLAFKAGCSDVRSSPAVALAELVASEGASVVAFDPIAGPVAAAIRRSTDPIQAVMDADVLVVATEWSELCDVDLAKVKLAMRGSAIVDARNLLDAEEVETHGFTYRGVGNGNRRGGSADGQAAVGSPRASEVAERPVPFMDLFGIHRPLMGEFREAFDRIVRRSSFIGGSDVESFESALAAYVGTAHAVGVGSGTAALLLALQAAGIGRGDEVLVPANTFAATVEAVVSAGAEPVVVDVLEGTALMDPEAAEAAVTPRTAAIVPVHLYGQPVDLDRIMRLARRHDLFVVEDAAQAIGARWNGRPAGSFGHAAAFSFYPGKNLGALGDAGAVTTDDAEIARRVTGLRNHGELQKSRHDLYGYTERLDAIQAAFLEIKLRHLDSWQQERDAAVARYRELLGPVGPVRLFEIDDRARHVHHLFVVRVAERDAVLDRLRSDGIGVGIHYPTPVHLQPAWLRSRPREEHPVAERLAAEILSLPLFPGISNTQIESTVSALLASTRESDEP